MDFTLNQTWPIFYDYIPLYKIWIQYTNPFKRYRRETHFFVWTGQIGHTMDSGDTICPHPALWKSQGHENIKTLRPKIYSKYGNLIPYQLQGFKKHQYKTLTLVLLNLGMPNLCKQYRSRSYSFFRCQLLDLHCHSVCEFVSTSWVKWPDWLTIRSGRGITRIRYHNIYLLITFWRVSLVLKHLIIKPIQNVILIRHRWTSHIKSWWTCSSCNQIQLTFITLWAKFSTWQIHGIYLIFFP